LSFCVILHPPVFIFFGVIWRYLALAAPPPGIIGVIPSTLNRRPELNFCVFALFSGHASILCREEAQEAKKLAEGQTRSNQLKLT
jgi:hypothetical protein